MGAKILVVDDDSSIRLLVSDVLTDQGLSVTAATSGEEALAILEEESFELILLDIMMKGIDGLEVCRRIRDSVDCPILFLSAKDSVKDITGALDLGADDYLTKPFELEVLYLRIQALLRRAGNASGRYLSCGGICLDRESRTVHSGSEKISLSPSEYQLLLCLLQNKGRTVTRESLLENVWDSNGSFVNDNTLTVTMKRLREKLNQPLCLKTVRSIGYCMEDNGI